jgi:Ca-activated chloride channel homolog
MKIADLLEQSRYEPSPYMAKKVKDVALEYRLLSPFTAFIALDASRRTLGEQGTTVPVAVPVPDGVRYETTVSE